MVINIIWAVIITLPNYMEVNIMGHCGCGCHSMRCFPTKEEKLEMLEEYKETLEKEAKGVDEMIKKLKKE